MNIINLGFFIICNIFLLWSTIGYIKIFGIKNTRDKFILGLLSIFVRILIFEIILGYVVQKLNYVTITIMTFIEWIFWIIYYHIKKESLFCEIKNIFNKLKATEIKLKITQDTVIIVALAIIIIVMGFISVAVYEYSYDGNYYHLPGIIDYVQDQKIEITQNTIWNNVYPKNAELLSMFYILFTKSLLLVRMPQLLFAILGMIVVYGVMREWNFSKQAGIKCAGLYLVCPFILSQLTTTYLDGIVVTLFITALYFLTKILKYNKLYDEIGYFMTLSIFMGTKGTCVIYAVVLSLVYIAFKIYNIVKKKENIKNIAIKWSAFLIIILTIGVSWMIQNIVLFGNPIHPFAFLNIDGLDANIDIGEENEPVSIRGRNSAVKILKSWIGLDCPYITDDYGRDTKYLYQTHDSRIGGLGIQWFYFLLPISLIAILAIISKKYKVNWIKSIMLVLVILCFAITPANWWGRYVGFIVLVGYLGFGIVEEIIKKHKILQILLTASWAIIMVFSILYGTKYSYSILKNTKPYEEYSDTLKQYIEQGNKNLIVLEESYYNTQAFVFLKGSKFQNKIDTYYIEEMYPNPKVANHGIKTYENFCKIIETYEDLDGILLLDNSSDRKNKQFLETFYEQNKEKYEKISYGEVVIYEKINKMDQ